MKLHYDFLVIGSGIGGLSFALKVAPYGKVAIITKTKLDDTNTRYAQGGIAAVTYNPDNFEKHVRDTLAAGCNFNDVSVVEMVVREAPAQIEQLIQWGIQFDTNESGKFDLAREGGHTEHRILHHKDITGYEIQRGLMHQIKTNPNIDIYEDHFSIDIITQHHLGRIITRYDRDIECFGAYILDKKQNIVKTFLAPVTMIATGGSGNLYLNTTNPEIATGDGISMVYRAKGLIENMEFMQFHPTAFYNQGAKPTFLITEALRGFGAKLRNCSGEEFMKKYDNRLELAPRDVVARAIDQEMKIHGDDFVYLDCRHLNSKALLEHFPNIAEHVRKFSLDITKDLIPVVFAAHYQCGGIKVDMNAQSYINYLYAAGEVASTGLHGANRLASNSLIEAVVYADKAAQHAINVFRSHQIPQNIPDWNDEGTTPNEEMVLITQSIKEVQHIMSNYVGIVRSNLRLQRAISRLEILHKETEDLYRRSKVIPKLCELRNLINVGYLVIKYGMRRKESIGLHYNIDYPPRLSE
jgi:L-aspartate oxidase